MTELNKEIKEAIDKNLPSLVGDQLKQVLIDYDRIKEANEDQEKQIKQLTKKFNDIDNLNRQYSENEQISNELDAKEIDLKAREALLEFKEKEWALRLGDIKEITKTVFQSNRFNYAVDVNRSGFENQNTNNGSISTRNINEKTMGIVSGEL